MDYPVLQERARLELARRVKILGQDVAAWTDLTRTDALGLSGPQRSALADMMRGFEARQLEAFQAIDKQLSAQAFSDGNANLIQEMTGSQELWRVFRSILGQLEDSALSEAAKSASRIAADCYTKGILRARELGAITPDRFRETPLVYLEALDSPAMAGRQQRTHHINASIRQWRDLKLPLPIVLLPIDYIQSISSYCCIHHEVGHNLDQDLELLPEIRAALPNIVTDPAIEARWRKWSEEILADALGIVLGGAGFALSIGSLALLLSPASRYQEFDPDAKHPPLALRVPLIADLLRRTKVPGHLQYADQLTNVWNTLPKPAWVNDFTGHTQAVADLYLGRKLTVLSNHSLLELNPELEGELKQTVALASYFLTRQNQPEPVQSKGMHPRLVPGAAQIAVWTANAVDAALLARIQQDAIAYLAKIPPITKLAAPIAEAAKRRTYFADLTKAIDFGKLQRNEAQ